jgi:RNA polymerase sigma-70 factor, ECF subfamily
MTRPTISASVYAAGRECCKPAAAGAHEIVSGPNPSALLRETSSRMTDPEFQLAYHGNKDIVYRFACRMTGSAMTAEDITQDCFLALWRNPAAYQPGRGALRAFLLGIARKMILKRWRAERPQDPLDDDSSITHPLDLVAEERSTVVAAAVQALPPLQREAVILAEYEDMSLEEISHATGSELAAVKSRLHRGRQNLRRMLASLLQPEGAGHGTE